MLIALVLLFQDPGVFAPESINAQVFQEGQRIDVEDVRIKAIDPYSFEFRDGDGSVLVSLFRVSRIRRMPDGKSFEMLMDNGETKQGRIKSLSFTGNPDKTNGKRQVFQLFHFDRIHLIHGNQLRACLQGHYEQYTAYPFCPVCGNELIIGPYPEDFPERGPSPPTHLLRQDSRDPASTAIRRN